MIFTGTLYYMRSATLRWIMLSSSIVISLILVAQLFWLKRVYTLEEQHFRINVLKTIRSLLTDIDIAEGQALQMKNLIETMDRTTFLVKIDKIPQIDTLQNYLTNELEDFDVWADCKVGVYNATKKKYEYEYFQPSAASHFLNIVDDPIPIFNKPYNYLLLQFSKKNNGNPSLYI